MLVACTSDNNEQGINNNNEEQQSEGNKEDIKIRVGDERCLSR